MKKIVLALMAMMVMTVAQAQDDNQRDRRDNRRMDRTEMTKRRTDDAVKKYGLDEDQAAKLLALNTKYADKIGGPGMGRGFRGGRGQRPAPNFGGNEGQPRNEGQRPEMSEEIRQQMEKMRKEREEAMKEYEAELQTIMTEDQYKAYKADQEQQRSRQGGRRGGPRRNDNNN